MKKRTLVHVFLPVALLFSCKTLSPQGPRPDADSTTLAAAASSATNDLLVRTMRIKIAKDRLMSLFDEGKGVWQGAEWWQQPNILETLGEYERQSPGEQPTFAWVADKVYTKNNRNGFINEFFDDTGWWGLAWVRAYELTRESRYLETSRAIFNYMARDGWVESTCRGGMRWKTDNPVKNAITTELFLRLALKLYFVTPAEKSAERDGYRAWATKAWTWFKASGMLDLKTGLIHDKLTMDTCKNNYEPAWTYNQGVILGALVDLAVMSGRDPRYLELAHKIAAANWRHNSQDNVLVEVAIQDQSDGPDGDIFKGIFLRYFRELWRHSTDEQKRRYIPHLTATAQSVWRNKSVEGFFDRSWVRPARGGGEAMRARTQVAGLDALLAAPAFADGPYVPDVCFYEKWGYMGRSNCYPVEAKGLAYRDFFDQSLNDKITSIRVFQGACLTVYEHWNEDPGQRGKSFVIDGGQQGKMIWLLNAFGMNDKITSFEARRCP